MKKLNWLSSRTVEQTKEITQRFWEKLSNAAYPVSKGAVRIPISLEPFSLTEQEYGALQKQLLLVISAARSLVEKYFVDTELRAVFSLDEAERELVEASKDEPLVGVVRADLFYGERTQLVELNTDFPDGFFMHDVTARAILDLVGPGLEINSNAALFKKLLEEEGVASDQHIFIGHDKGRSFVDEFALSRDVLQKEGWSAVSVGPVEDLVQVEGALTFNGKPVHVMRRGAEMSKLRENKALMARLIQQQKEGTLKIFNNFKMRLLGHKALLAVLWDERFEKYLSKEEIAAAHALVPETRKLSEIGVAGTIHEKNDWVLKPSDLAEGEGVLIGSSCSEEVWAAALQSASEMSERWLLQRKVQIPKETFNIFDTGTKALHTSTMHYDLDPHIMLFRDRAEMGNILVRFSPDEVLNVMCGGGITYAFVDEKLSQPQV
ncbi:MAG: hypothetical protein WC030_01495 [Candidatus Paceibacterota bacterium]